MTSINYLLSKQLTSICISNFLFCFSNLITDYYKTYYFYIFIYADIYIYIFLYTIYFYHQQINICHIHSLH